MKPGDWRFVSLLRNPSKIILIILLINYIIPATSLEGRESGQLFKGEFPLSLGYHATLFAEIYPVANFVNDLYRFTAKIGLRGIFQNFRNRLKRKTGIDILKNSSLKKAGIDLNRPVYIGSNEGSNLYALPILRGKINIKRIETLMSSFQRKKKRRNKKIQILFQNNPITVLDLGKSGSHFIVNGYWVIISKSKALGDWGFTKGPGNGLSPDPFREALASWNQGINIKNAYFKFFIHPKNLFLWNELLGKKILHDNSQKKLGPKFAPHLVESIYGSLKFDKVFSVYFHFPILLEGDPFAGTYMELIKGKENRSCSFTDLGLDNSIFTIQVNWSHPVDDPKLRLLRETGKIYLRSLLMRYQKTAKNRGKANFKSDALNRGENFQELFQFLRGQAFAGGALLRDKFVPWIVLKIDKNRKPGSQKTLEYFFKKLQTLLEPLFASKPFFSVNKDYIIFSEQRKIVKLVSGKISKCMGKREKAQKNGLHSIFSPRRLLNRNFTGKIPNELILLSSLFTFVDYIYINIYRERDSLELKMNLTPIN